jgi:hypothetical protein
MLHAVSSVFKHNKCQHTKLNGIVAYQQREHPNDSCKTRALSVRYDAHWYTRGIHAQVRRGALVLVRRCPFKRYSDMHTMTLLCVADS